MAHTSVPGLEASKATEAIQHLEDRLVGLIDTQLVLKHIHWNVMGPNFIAVHEMLDEQVDAVRLMTDEVAERIAILGGTPNGTPGHVVETRTWDDYQLGRASVEQHLDALDSVYDGVIADHRAAIEGTGTVDPITEDLLIGQSAKLELFQWFVRSHIENAGGRDRTADRDATAAHVAGRGPTKEEAAAAERNAPQQPDVEAEYREMTRIGATTNGEGRI
ncbi:MAG: DNA starvation/stationary phase protection protein [Acidimicrobiales bacterium]